MRQTIYYHLYRLAPPGSVLEYWAFKKWMSTGWQRPRTIDRDSQDTTSYDPRTR